MNSPAPQLQYFQPSGPFLPPVRWRKNAHGWVWVVSVIVALILVVITALALLSGIVRSSRFTAHGALQVDCATERSIDGQPIGFGSAVVIFESGSGEVVARTSLDRLRTLAEDADACLALFRVDDLQVDNGGYLVKIGETPARLVSREALESGVVFN